MLFVQPQLKHPQIFSPYTSPPVGFSVEEVAGGSIREKADREQYSTNYQYKDLAMTGKLITARKLPYSAGDLWWRGGSAVDTPSLSRSCPVPAGLFSLTFSDRLWAATLIPACGVSDPAGSWVSCLLPTNCTPPHPSHGQHPRHPRGLPGFHSKLGRLCSQRLVRQKREGTVQYFAKIFDVLKFPS